MNQTRIFFLLGICCSMAATPLMAIDLIERSGRYIHLTTDLDSAAEAEELVVSFDAAVPQWLQFWGLPENSVADWRVNAVVIGDQTEARRAGLIPDNVPKFPFGYALGDSLWVMRQKSSYYTRHLLLHEGVHAFAFSQFGGAGPTWFMEGTAELLALHSGSGAQIQINRIPPDRESVPYWGRFKLIDQLRSQGRLPSIETVMKYQPTLTGNVETYGWSWAAVMMFQAYEEYRPAYLAAGKYGKDEPLFNRRLYQQIGPAQWPVLAARWRVLCHELDYGFDWESQRVELAETDPLWDGNPFSKSIAANHGWQSLGVRFAAGTTIRLQPSGQVVLDTQPKPWTSTPAGITIEYRRGRPLGQLLACVLPNATARSNEIAPLQIVPLQADQELKIDEHSWVLLQVNDAVGKLDDNSGSYLVNIQ